MKTVYKIIGVFWLILLGFMLITKVGSRIYGWQIADLFGIILNSWIVISIGVLMAIIIHIINSRP